MRHIESMAAAAWLAWAVLGAPAASAQPRSPSEAFAAGSQAFAGEDFAGALNHFEAALEGGMTGPAIRYNLGVCYYRLGRYEEAAAEFALISEQYPQMRGLAEYNLGLVARRQGEDGRADAHFREALAATDDETIRALALQQLPDERRRDEPASASWLTLVDAQVGYDDNVLLLADEIPLPDGQSSESAFVELWGLVSGPVREDAGFRVDASVYVLRYPDAGMFDQSVVRVGTPYRWDAGAWSGAAGPHVSWTSIDGALLDRRIGAGVRMSRALGESASIGVRYVHDEVDEGERQYAFFAGSRDWLELRVDRALALGNLTVAYAYEQNDRRGSSVSPERDKLSARYRRSLNDDWRLDVGGSLRDSRYGELSVPRDEDLKELSVRLTRELDAGWEVSGFVSVADNDSNVETVVYDRNRVSIGITKQF